MTTVMQDDFKVEAFGMVVNPPTVSEVVCRITDAADAKESLTLTPSECRVLANLLNT